MIIEFKGQKCKVVFGKYENGNTNFKIYDEDDKVVESPTVDIGYVMNKEYVTIKNRDKQDTLGKELEKAGVLFKKLDSINLEHSGALSIYILPDSVKAIL